MQNPATDLQEALAAAADLAAGKRKPHRFDVRALFVPLGALILEGDAAAVEPTLELLGSFIRNQDEAWQRVVAEELGLAGDEYCLSVDTKYLDLPDYDLAYTESSREYLECRLRAAEHLGFPTPEGLEGRIQAADALLEPYLDRHDDARPAAEPPA